MSIICWKFELISAQNTVWFDDNVVVSNMFFVTSNHVYRFLQYLSQHGLLYELFRAYAIYNWSNHMRVCTCLTWCDVGLHTLHIFFSCGDSNSKLLRSCMRLLQGPLLWLYCFRASFKIGPTDLYEKEHALWVSVWISPLKKRNSCVILWLCFFHLIFDVG